METLRGVENWDISKLQTYLKHADPPLSPALAGAFYDYVWKMLVVYFKNDQTSFREQGFSLIGDISQTCWLVKSTNCQYLVLEAKNEKNKVTFFL